MLKRTLSKVLFVMLFIGGWYVFWWSGRISPAILPSPLEVARSLPSFLSPVGFLPDVTATVYRSVIAFALSVPLGIVLAFLVFYITIARDPGEAFLDFVRSIPSTAMVPIFLLVFGVGDSSKIAGGVYSSSLVICLGVLAGLAGRSHLRLGIAALMEMPPATRFVYVDLPECLPQMFVGLRTGISLALILVVVGEMTIGSNRGLGKVVNDMRNSDAVPQAYAALVILGTIGFLYNHVLIGVQKKVVHWQGR